MLSHLGPMELVIILVIVIIIFGVGKLPEIGGALGKGIKEFRNANKEVEAAKKDLEAAAEPEKKDETAKKA